MLPLFALLLQVVQPDTTPLRGARSPAYASDGRLAVSVDGDLYAQVIPNGRWVQITSGPAWDRDPAWTRDGRGIVFSSDRGGTFAIWRIPVGSDGAARSPERLTSSRDDESAPNVAPDGSIAFVRGFGGAARVWILPGDGRERRLTDGEQTELAPAFSPDGSRLAYVQVFEAGRRLLVRTLASGRDGVVVGDRVPERLAWSPAGDRILFSTSGARPGIYVAPVNATYVNFVASRRGDVAWSPDGKTIAIAEHEEPGSGYNGDPARLGDRAVREPFGTRGALVLVTAPTAPDADRREAAIAAARDRASRNADVFDQVWQRSATLYFSAPDAAERRAQWVALKTKYRAQAVAARDDDELQRVLHRMIRERPVLRASATGRAAVSSAHPVATEAGLEILRAGGNVVDAAVAVSFALGVVEPDASGVGGYGQMVIALAKLEKPALIEFMTRVPEEASLANTALLVNGRYPSDGPVLANVPGTVAGMHRAFRLYGSGKVAWKDLLGPAIRAARDGYIVSDGLATTLSTEREHFAKYEGSRRLFFRDGKPLAAGDTLRNPDLAWTLEQIAARGADGFYQGEVARRIVDDLRGKGNAMKLTDLSRYYAVDREPVSGTYRGYTLYSSAPPVSGGADLVGKLNALEQFASPKLYTDDAATLHAALSAWTLAPRGRVADPGLWAVDLTGPLSKDSAKARWRCFTPEKALRAAEVMRDSVACARGGATVTPDSDKRDAPCGEDHAAEVEFCHAAGTTSFAVADNEGNVVSVTQTLGTWGGNFYVTPGLGFLYNDKLTSYGTDPNAYGARLPFARHGSTLAPTIAFKGPRPVFAVGAAGNAWITSAVYQTLIGMMDFGLDPQRALELPRFLPGGRGGAAPVAPPSDAPLLTAEPAGAGAAGPGGRGGGGRGGGFGLGGRGGAAGPVSVQIEDGFSPDVLKRLREMGYEFELISLKGELRQGYGAAIAIDGKKVTAGADPRRAGSAGAVP
jgi:gamma-glutamyltranspeptidase